jgi:hypothetical protein
LLEEQAEARAEALARRDRLRQAAELSTPTGRVAYLAHLADLARASDAGRPPLASIGAAVAAGLHVRLRNAARLLTSIGHEIGQQFRATALEPTATDE